MAKFRTQAQLMEVTETHNLFARSSARENSNNKTSKHSKLFFRYNNRLKRITYTIADNTFLPKQWAAVITHSSFNKEPVHFAYLTGWILTTTRNPKRDDGLISNASTNRWSSEFSTACRVFLFRIVIPSPFPNGNNAI